MIPNAFTPNGDGKNDRFGPIINCNVTSYHLMIFNRWGQMVFDTVDANDKWDGNFKGVPADVGDYFYSLTFAGPKGNTYSYKGDITLIR